MSITLTLAASLMASLLLFAGLWAATQRSDDISVIDAFWGPGFVLVGAVTLALSEPASVAAWLILTCVTAWGLRLGAYMAFKHHERGGEDPRYRAMREARGEAFATWSLTRVFCLQAVVLWLVATPLHVGMTAGSTAPLVWMVTAGALVFATGFAIEVVADLQMVRFRRTRQDPALVFDGGLWGVSRHPNYFGEALLWWGLGLMGHGTAGGTALGLFAYLGPVLITGLLLKVSGVAMLEPMLMRDKPGYAAYRQRVSAFVPWWPRRP